jgi:predicted permease
MTVGNVLHDLRYGFRSLRSRPAFTATAVLTLALGIAVSTVVFSWIDMVMLQPLPGTSDGQRLFIFESKQPDNEGLNISYPDFRDYRDNLKLSSVALAYQNKALSLGEGEHAERVWAELVSGNYFTVMGVKPLLGRFFLPEEQGDQPGAHPVAVISARLWRSRFHSDPHVLGSAIRVNRRELTIIGVAPPEFYGMMRGLAYEMWAPLTMGPQLNRFSERVLQDRPPRMFNAIARVNPGASIQQARAEAESVARELAARYPQTNEGFGITLLSENEAHGTVRNRLGGPLWILMAMCVVVLLIACVNVANLLLARSVSRQHELSIRLALGASRARIVGQLLTEALLLAGLGTVVSVPLAMWMEESIAYLAPVSIGIPIQIEPPSLNVEILVFTTLICIVAALASGISPALEAIRPDVNDGLKEGGRSGASGAHSHRMRGLFVVSEVALAFVALIGAGLFVKNFAIAKTIQPGFDARNVLVSRFYTSMSGYSEDQRKQFCVQLRERLQPAPGIVNVTYADSIPLGFGLGGQSELQIEGYVPARNENMSVGRTRIAPGYFDVLRIPLLEGRDFTEQDDVNTAPVAIVNEPFARRYFAGRNPVGRKIHGLGKWLTVVGLVKGSKYYLVTEPPRPYFYVPFRQVPAPEDIVFYVRAAGDPANAIATLRREAAAVDPDASVFDAMPLADYIDAPLFPQRFAASLLSALGAMSLLLAAVGLYSVMAYAVSQRTHEIGIRLAMGARPRDVLAIVIRKGIILTGAGMLAGMAVALAGARLVSGMLANVSTADPLIFAATSLFIVLVALLATYLPARRASKVDPIVALRQS